MTTKAMPSQGQDLKQGVYRTDHEFMAVINKKHRLIGDLAANAENKQAYLYLTEAENALDVNWREWYEFCQGDENCQSHEGYLWLNPPYDDIAAWARKCAMASVAGVKILFLVPASVGSSWYRRYVESFARVDFLTGRLVFDFLYPEDYIDRATAKKNIERAKLGLPAEFSPKAGQRNTDPYPKDMLLATYDCTIPMDQRLAQTWAWRCHV